MIHKKSDTAPLNCRFNSLIYHGAIMLVASGQHSLCKSELAPLEINKGPCLSSDLFHNFCQYIQIYNHSGNFQQDAHTWRHSGMDQASIRRYLKIRMRRSDIKNTFNYSICTIAVIIPAQKETNFFCCVSLMVYDSKVMDQIIDSVLYVKVLK